MVVTKICPKDYFFGVQRSVVFWCSSSSSRLFFSVCTSSSFPFEKCLLTKATYPHHQAQAR